jgi:hypothetical protein
MIGFGAILKAGQWFLGTRVGRWIMLALGGALVLWRAVAGIRKAERDKLESAQLRDTLKRTDAGRAAAQKAQQEIRKGKTPAEIVRDNDGKW